MAKIFVSHAYSEQELVNPIIAELKSLGHEIYPGYEIVTSENELKTIISEEISSSDFILPVLTEASINSNWVIYEVSTAVGYNKERNRPFIIPFVFDNVNVPDFLQTLTVVRASRSELKKGISNLISTMQVLIGKEIAKQEESKEVIAEVKRISASYINDTLIRLKRAERNYKGIAYLCFSASFIFLVGSLFYLYTRKTTFISPQSDLMIQQIASIIFNVVLYSVIIAISRYVFILGKSFMVESLRNSDRIHAISFGSFYLNAYGEKAEWSEIKEAFQHWNIDTGSTFKSQNPSDYDPEIFKQLVTLVESIKK